MARRGNELDDLEPARRDFQEVLPRQPLTLVEVRRHPELPFRHRPNFSLYATMPFQTEHEASDGARSFRRSARL